MNDLLKKKRKVFLIISNIFLTLQRNKKISMKIYYLNQNTEGV
jgi:hypothetical protein